jgi:hypothetical protein
VSLSPEQIRWGYWNWIRAQKQVPDHITYLEEYDLIFAQIQRVSI